MGLGTVPLLTPGVDSIYHHPLIRDEHFLFAENQEQVANAINNCSREKWVEMSNNCQEWYNKNCSPSGSFAVTNEIMESCLK